MIRRNTTKLELSGVAFPPGSDLRIAENLKLIGGAADMRRTVNAGLVNVARTAFRKRSLSLSGDDMRPAALHHLFPGDYVEVIPVEPLAVTLPAPATSAQIPVGAVEVVGLTDAGELVQPDAQPADPRPLSVAHDPARVAALRASAPVIFPTAVRVVRFRPVLCCLVTDVNSAATEGTATAGWSLELEEV